MKVGVIMGSKSDWATMFAAVEILEEFGIEHEVEVVTGVNLPMLIKLATLSEPKPLAELAVFIKSYGQRNISVASEILPDEAQ